MTEAEVSIVALLLCRGPDVPHAGGPEARILVARRLALVQVGRRAGLTYRAMSEMLGISENRVRQLDIRAEGIIRRRYGLPPQSPSRRAASGPAPAPPVGREDDAAPAAPRARRRG